LGGGESSEGNGTMAFKSWEKRTMGEVKDDKTSVPKRRGFRSNADRGQRTVRKIAIKAVMGSCRGKTGGFARLKWVLGIKKKKSNQPKKGNIAWWGESGRLENQEKCSQGKAVVLLKGGQKSCEGNKDN